MRLRSTSADGNALDRGRDGAQRELDHLRLFQHLERLVADSLLEHLPEVLPRLRVGYGEDAGGKFCGRRQNCSFRLHPKCLLRSSERWALHSGHWGGLACELNICRKVCVTYRPSRGGCTGCPSKAHHFGKLVLEEDRPQGAEKDVQPLHPRRLSPVQTGKRRWDGSATLFRSWKQTQHARGGTPDSDK